MARVTRLKRVYDAAEADDGWRVLVDRLWPRGVSRERAAWHRDPEHNHAVVLRDHLEEHP
ncbi:DUF488 family protein [Microbacterium sp. JZ70]|nr:DUF488 family protein [Microbacterium sp. JZ37]WRH17692.1 DUF488 family protein [Microbacterium sp. JZ37]